MTGTGFRESYLKGRACYVADVVMITVGVHNGSAGPLYYSAEELSKFPESWAGRPVVVYHPNAITANEKGVIESSVVGQVLNVRYYNNKLVGEAWIYKDDVRSIDPRVEQAILKNMVMEVSTGLFAEYVNEPGIWNGEAYEKRAVAYRPDHLAILPDQVGACSINDGAGLLRNKQNEAAQTAKNSLNFTEEKNMDRKQEIQDLIANSKFEESDGEFLEALSDEQFARVVNAAVIEDKVEPTGEEETVIEPVVEDENPVENAAPTFDELLAAAPAEVRTMIENGLAKIAAEKAEVIEGILANESNQFEKDFLESQNIDFLTKLSATIKPKKVENAARIGQGGGVIENTVKIEPLGLPSSL